MTTLAALLVFGAAAFAQESSREPALTGDEALEILRGVQDLMVRSEELLNDSSRGRALDPSAPQRRILGKIESLMAESEGKQKDAADRMGDVIRRIREGGGCCNKEKPTLELPKAGKRPLAGSDSRGAPGPGGSAPNPYAPDRRDEIEKFRGTGQRSGNWGNLPPRLRQAMLWGKRSSDDFPPEYQQVLQEYLKRLADEKD